MYTLEEKFFYIYGSRNFEVGRSTGTLTIWEVLVISSACDLEQDI